jgi:hypothetical protein
MKNADQFEIDVRTRSRDLMTWEDVTSRISFPPGARHGTVVEAPAGIVKDIDR